jgi:hypothetical protein
MCWNGQGTTIVVVKNTNFYTKNQSTYKEAVFFTPIPTTGSADGTQLKHSCPNDGLFISLDIMPEGKEHVSFTHMLVCTHTHTHKFCKLKHKKLCYPS